MIYDDINDLLNAINCEYAQADWELFIDNSKRSLRSFYSTMETKIIESTTGLASRRDQKGMMRPIV